MQTSRVNNSKILKIKNMKFMRTTRVFILYEPTDIVNFSNLHHSVPLSKRASLEIIVQKIFQDSE